MKIKCCSPENLLSTVPASFSGAFVKVRYKYLLWHQAEAMFYQTYVNVKMISLQHDSGFYLGVSTENSFGPRVHNFVLRFVQRREWSLFRNFRRNQRSGSFVFRPTLVCSLEPTWPALMSSVAFTANVLLLCGNVTSALGSQLWLQELCSVYKPEPSQFMKVPETTTSMKIGSGQKAADKMCRTFVISVFGCKVIGFEMHSAPPLSIWS